jgi:hypothetical protein
LALLANLCQRIALDVRKSRKNLTTHTQNKALAALVQQPTIHLAAAEAGITPRTLYRWIATDEAFKAEHLKLRREVVNNAVFQLQKATNNTVNCLTSVMNDPEAAASARVRAAEVVLTQAFRALEIEALEERLERLEAAVAQQATHAKGYNPRRAFTWMS